MVKMRLLAVVFVFGLVFLAGCIQPQAAKRCERFSVQSEKEECLNYMAVWYQDPYTCYEISDMQLREECLESSVDPKEARKLQVEKENQRRVVVREDDELVQQKEAEGPVKECMDSEGLGREACMHRVGIETLNMSMCNEISLEEYRRPCVTNVAIKLKNLDECGKLEHSSDVQLCTFYSTD